VDDEFSQVYHDIRVLNVNGIRGTSDDDDACSGCIGEYQESIISNQSVGASAQYSDITSISLTSGDWDADVCVAFTPNGATITENGFGVTPYSGNDGTGLLTAHNTIQLTNATSTLNSAGCISNVRFSLSATTTIYAKQYLVYTVATPKVYSRLSARRVR
jgi:hypothetical protein